MSLSHKCGSTSRQLPSTPSCQCHALLSYKARPEPAFRPEAPEESLKELFDDIFRMGTAYLIRSGERISPAEMAYFEYLNELDVPECVSPPRLDKRTEASGSQTSSDDVAKPEDTQQPEQQLQMEELGTPEPQNSEGCQDTKLAFQNQQDIIPLTTEKITCAVVPESPNPIKRYITEDQLGSMGWKDLFKLARVRGIWHGPMMKSKQELLKKFVEKFGVEIPIYANDKLPKEFPSKHSTSRWVCGHRGRHHRPGPAFRRY